MTIDIIGKLIAHIYIVFYLYVMQTYGLGHKCFFLLSHFVCINHHVVIILMVVVFTVSKRLTHIKDHQYINTLSEGH
jgi:hypothetical protein